jgi:hypothetical protein
MKIEVGKTYEVRNFKALRDGKVVITHTAEYDKTTRYYSRCGMWWHENGRFSVDGKTESDYDLVREVFTAQDAAFPDLVRAVLDGRKLQSRITSGENTSQWRECTALTDDLLRAILNSPESGVQFRIKPKPVVRYIGVTAGGDFGFAHTSRSAALENNDYGPVVEVLRIDLSVEDRWACIALVGDRS